MKKIFLSISICIPMLALAQIHLIPVVVYVVYNLPVENISDELIMSEINALNRDYSALNGDTISIPDVLRDSITDTQIRFELADITRNTTTVSEWNLFASPGSDNYAEKIKSAATGGANPWDTECYLNIWVGNLNSATLGYAAFPGSSPEVDGVVISYPYFGTGESVVAGYDSGRVTIHEVGHWLGLYHVTSVDGLEACYGADPEPEAEDYNFMNYNSDYCSLMFFPWQRDEMLNVLETSRSEIGVCYSANAVSTNPKYSRHIYPNPAQDYIILEALPANARIQICDLSGTVAMEIAAIQHTMELDISVLPPGLYILHICDANNVFTAGSIIKL